jgi:hypothetical protein
MKLNNEKWLANLKKVVEQTKWQASSGQACAVATVMTIKQGMIDDVGEKEGNEDTLNLINDSLKELVEEIAKPETKLQGFASNASAAAKAAGLEVKQVAVAMLGDLMA